MDARGLAAVAAVHGDTDNPHCHIVLNRVDPVTRGMRQVGGAFPLWRAQEVAAILDRRFGLSTERGTLHAADRQRPQPGRTGEGMREDAGSALHREPHRFAAGTGQQEHARANGRPVALPGLTPEEAGAVARALRGAGSWTELAQRLAALGLRPELTRGPKGGRGLRLVAADGSGRAWKASAFGRDCALAALAHRLGQPTQVAEAAAPGGVVSSGVVLRIPPPAAFRRPVPARSAHGTRPRGSSAAWVAYQLHRTVLEEQLKALVREQKRQIAAERERCQRLCRRFVRGFEPSTGRALRASIRAESARTIALIRQEYDLRFAGLRQARLGYTEWCRRGCPAPPRIAPPPFLGPAGHGAGRRTGPGPGWRLVEAEGHLLVWEREGAPGDRITDAGGRISWTGGPQADAAVIAMAARWGRCTLSASRARLRELRPLVRAHGLCVRERPTDPPEWRQALARLLRAMRKELRLALGLDGPTRRQLAGPVTPGPGAPLLAAGATAPGGLVVRQAPQPAREARAATPAPARAGTGPGARALDDAAAPERVPGGGAEPGDRRKDPAPAMAPVLPEIGTPAAPACAPATSVARPACGIGREDAARTAAAAPGGTAPGRTLPSPPPAREPHDAPSRVPKAPVARPAGGIGGEDQARTAGSEAGRQRAPAALDPRQALELARAAARRTAALRDAERQAEAAHEAGPGAPWTVRSADAGVTGPERSASPARSDASSPPGPGHHGAQPQGAAAPAPSRTAGAFPPRAAEPASVPTGAARPQSPAAGVTRPSASPSPDPRPEAAAPSPDPRGAAPVPGAVRAVEQARGNPAAAAGASTGRTAVPPGEAPRVMPSGAAGSRVDGGVRRDLPAPPAGTAQQGAGAASVQSASTPVPPTGLAQPRDAGRAGSEPPAPAGAGASTGSVARPSASAAAAPAPSRAMSGPAPGTPAMPVADRVSAPSRSPGPEAPPSRPAGAHEAEPERRTITVPRPSAPAPGSANPHRGAAAPPATAGAAPGGTLPSARPAREADDAPAQVPNASVPAHARPGMTASSGGSAPPAVGRGTTVHDTGTPRPAGAGAAAVGPDGVAARPAAPKDTGAGHHAAHVGDRAPVLPELATPAAPARVPEAPPAPSPTAEVRHENLPRTAAAAPGGAAPGGTLQPPRPAREADDSSARVGDGSMVEPAGPGMPGRPDGTAAAARGPGPGARQADDGLARVPGGGAEPGDRQKDPAPARAPETPSDGEALRQRALAALEHRLALAREEEKRATARREAERQDQAARAEAEREREAYGQFPRPDRGTLPAAAEGALAPGRADIGEQVQDRPGLSSARPPGAGPQGEPSAGPGHWPAPPGSDPDGWAPGRQMPLPGSGSGHDADREPAVDPDDGPEPPGGLDPRLLAHLRNRGRGR